MSWKPITKQLGRTSTGLLFLHFNLAHLLRELVRNPDAKIRIKGITGC